MGRRRAVPAGVRNAVQRHTWSAAQTALAPLRSLVDEARALAAEAESVASLARFLALLAVVALVAGVAVVAWLLSRVLENLPLAAPASTTAAASSGALAGATGPRWGVPPVWMVVALLAALAVILGGAGLAFRRGRMYLVFLCVALIGVEIMVLESYTQVFATPIFGQFVVLAAVLGAAGNFAAGVLRQRAEKKVVELQEKFRSELEKNKKDFVAKVWKALQDDPDLEGLKDKLKDTLNNFRPEVQSMILDQIRQMQGPIMKALEPLIEQAIQMAKAKTLEAGKEAALSPLRAIGSAFGSIMGAASGAASGTPPTQPGQPGYEQPKPQTSGDLQED